MLNPCPQTETKNVSLIIEEAKRTSRRLTARSRRLFQCSNREEEKRKRVEGPVLANRGSAQSDVCAGLRDIARVRGVGKKGREPAFQQTQNGYDPTSGCGFAGRDFDHSLRRHCN